MTIRERMPSLVAQLLPRAYRQARAGLFRWGLARLCVGLVAATSLTLLAASAFAVSTSPGKLAQSHAKLDTKCGKCHDPVKGVTDQLCLDCHKEAKTSRFHSKMAKDSGKKCGTCHRDHRGRNFRMIRWRPPNNFDHKHTGWRLKGKHTDTPCAKCHTRPQRWMGLKTACQTCHSDPHKPSLGADCKSCHVERAFRPAPSFKHSKTRFPLRGKHQDVACGKCHDNFEKSTSFRGMAFGACKDCHDEPVPEHSRGVACKSCHKEKGWRQTKPRAGPRLHEKLAFALTGKHVKVKCEDCHKDRRKVTSASTPAARLGLFDGLRGECVNCHEDPHDNKFGSRCEDCHTTAGWKAKRSKKGFDHNKTDFPLRGRHRFVACAKCHPSRGSYDKRFTRIKHERCTDCHKDPHEGEFASVQDSNRCEDCHSESGFMPSNFTVQRHADARFKLAGAHRVIPCGDCHKKSTVVINSPPAKQPRRRRRRRRRKRASAAPQKLRVARLVGTPQACKDCHDNPHGAQFDNREPALQCTSCHSDRSFTPAPRFSHDDTGFKLEGPHAEAACSACHTRPADGKPVRFAGVKTGCADCHNDVHAGQFLAGGPVKRCADCHSLVKGFRIEDFDHSKTRFALQGQHAKVTCGACHNEVTAPNGQRAVHYRLGPMACAQCHSNPHDRRRRP